MAAEDRDRVRVVGDRPQDRQSPVRRVHAAIARQHGRASTPGYLGLPIEDPEADATSDDQDEEEQGGGSRRSGGSSRSAGGAGKRQRTAGKGKGGGSGGSRRGGGGQRRARSSSRSSGGSRSAGGGSRSSGGASSNGSDGPGGAPEAESSPLQELTSGLQDRLHDAAEEARDLVGGGAHPGRKLAMRLARKAALAGVKAAGRGVTHAAESLTEKAGDQLTDAAQDVTEKAQDVAEKARSAAGPAKRRQASGGAEGSRSETSRRQKSEQEPSLGVPLRTLPIQQSVDIAVPIEVAWEQWMEFRHLPEGARKAIDVSRKGDELHGVLDGLGARRWRAQVIDERRCESFAWRSLEGSDSAGLVTFHELGERLTRIELNLDIRPKGLLEAGALTLHLADRRVEAELRRLKAEAELLNPDIYGELLSSRNGKGRSGKGSGGGRR